MGDVLSHAINKANFCWPVFIEIGIKDTTNAREGEREKKKDFRYVRLFGHGIGIIKRKLFFLFLLAKGEHDQKQNFLYYSISERVIQN